MPGPPGLTIYRRGDGGDRGADGIPGTPGPVGDTGSPGPIVSGIKIPCFLIPFKNSAMGKIILQ